MLQAVLISPYSRIDTGTSKSRKSLCGFDSRSRNKQIKKNKECGKMVQDGVKKYGG